MLVKLLALGDLLIYLICLPPLLEYEHLNWGGGQEPNYIHLSVPNLSGCLALWAEKMTVLCDYLWAARSWMTCSFPQVFLRWRMSCSWVEATSSQGYCSAFHTLRHPGPGASSRGVSAHFKWDNVKKHSWMWMLTAKPHEDQPDLVGHAPLNPMQNLKATKEA